MSENTIFRITERADGMFDVSRHWFEEDMPKIKGCDHEGLTLREATAYCDAGGAEYRYTIVWLDQRGEKGPFEKMIAGWEKESASDSLASISLLSQGEMALMRYAWDSGILDGKEGRESVLALLSEVQRYLEHMREYIACPICQRAIETDSPDILAARELISSVIQKLREG